jgi:hypothetical protein
MQAIGAVLLLAVLTEWLTERFFGGLWTGRVMVGISTAIGVALCVVFKVDAIILLGVNSPWSEWANIVVTGLIVGGGSQAIHKFFSKFIPEG